MKRKGLGLIFQIYILVAAGVIVLGVITYYSQSFLSLNEMKSNVLAAAEEVSDETIAAVKEYPAYKWLLEYCCEHADTLDIEYDVDFESGAETGRKLALFSRRNPDIQLQYASSEVLEALPEEDRKLCAEIMYSWLITRINQIKRAAHVDYLYCVAVDTDASDAAYEDMVYLFSAADQNSVRGSEYGQVYTLGVTVSGKNSESLKQIMRDTVENARIEPKFRKKKSGIDDTGKYLDVYAFLDWVGTRAALVGVSFNLEKEMQDAASATWKGTAYAMFYQFLLLQIILLQMFFVFIRPLKDVLKSIRWYGRTKEGEEVRNRLQQTISGVRGIAVRHNEIGQLVDDFTDLTFEIEEHIRKTEEITAQNERIEAELKLASGIQAQMVPEGHPQFAKQLNIDLYATMDPAREVGGDFFDYFMTDDTHLALVIADVSGKGVPAALFMVIAKTLIKNRAQAGESPAEILENVNDQLCDGNKMNFFVTVWIAVIDLQTGKGKAANAGHEHPAICRADGLFELVKYKHSPIIGMIENVNYREHDFELYPGDRLFVYTDGVPEAINKDQKMFGTDRMIEILNHEPDAPLEKLLHHMRQEIDVFADGAEQFDDITMMCFWYKPEEE